MSSSSSSSSSSVSSSDLCLPVDVLDETSLEGLERCNFVEDLFCGRVVLGIRVAVCRFFSIGRTWPCCD